LFATLAVWTADTTALLVGTFCGRHQLTPVLSPGKTWEGAIAGLGASFLAVIAMDRVLSLPLALGIVVLLGMLLPMLGLVGDLTASALKRSFGLKDFGQVFPGHGGITDRLDSLLLAVPFVWYCVRMVG
jgi:phosphatidate cytidylyltransferase